MMDNFVDAFLELRKAARKRGHSIMYILIPNPGDTEITVARPTQDLSGKEEVDELLTYFMENSEVRSILPPGHHHPAWYRVLRNVDSKTFFRFDIKRGGESWFEIALVKLEEVI